MVLDDLPGGIQVVRVDRQGRLQLSLATGCVSYTSWQPLHENDPFPCGSPAKINGFTVNEEE